MNVIYYGKHFALLGTASVVLAMSFDAVAAALPVDRLHLYFASVGLLHSTAWVMSLRVGKRIVRRLAFVLVATTLSVGAPYLGLTIGAAVPLKSDEVRFISTFAAGSAGGAAAYWLAVRAFWLPDQAFSSLVRTMVMCVIATLAAWVVQGIATGQGSDPGAVPVDLPTLFWWLAFSSSFLMVGPRASQKRGQSPTEAGWLTKE